MYCDSAMHYSGTCFQENGLENYCMCKNSRALNSTLRWVEGKMGFLEMGSIRVTFEVRIGLLQILAALN